MSLDVVKRPCSCCGLADIKGQWWTFYSYSTGTRLISGYHCPVCSNKVFAERKEYEDNK